MDHFPLAWGLDTYLMRNLPATLKKSGMSRVEQIRLDMVVDTDKLSFGFNIATRAVNIYGKSGLVRYFQLLRHPVLLLLWDTLYYYYYGTPCIRRGNNGGPWDPSYQKIFVLTENF